jgi:hypothetical protein
VTDNQPIEIGQWRMSPLGVPVCVDGPYSGAPQYFHFRVRAHLTLDNWRWSMVGGIELSSWPVIDAPARAEE